MTNAACTTVHSRSSMNRQPERRRTLPSPRPPPSRGGRFSAPHSRASPAQCPGAREAPPCARSPTREALAPIPGATRAAAITPSRRDGCIIFSFLFCPVTVMRSADPGASRAHVQIRAYSINIIGRPQAGPRESLALVSGGHPALWRCGPRRPSPWRPRPSS